MPSVADLKLLSSGKVREIYEWDDDLLMVASDRISTYDVVMPTPIPDKGKVLNRMSVFWFGLTEDIVPNHFISEDVPEEVAERAMRVRKLEMYPVECVVRGYLSGSGWKEYKESGSGLRDRAALRPGRVRPAAGADLHPLDQGRDRRPRRERRLRPRRRDRRRPGAAGRAAAGLDRGLRARLPARGRSGGSSSPTPSSSSAATPAPRSSSATRSSPPTPPASGPPPATSPASPLPPSTSSSSATGRPRPGWDKKPPAPELPADVVEQTRAKYVEAYERITGESF